MTYEAFGDWSPEHLASTLWTPPSLTISDTQARSFEVFDSTILTSETKSKKRSSCRQLITTQMMDIHLPNLRNSASFSGNQPPHWNHLVDSDMTRSNFFQQFPIPNASSPESIKLRDTSDTHSAFTNQHSMTFRPSSLHQPEAPIKFTAPCWGTPPFLHENTLPLETNALAMNSTNRSDYLVDFSPTCSNRAAQLQVTFLPAEANTEEKEAKFGKMAKIAKLCDGTSKLFVERGRLVETCVTLTDYRPLTDENVALKDNGYKLRFIPYTSFGGVCKPAIGYHNQIQKAHYVPTEQLCFVQLFEARLDTWHQYQTDGNGYLFLETVLTSRCGIYQLVFPFHNSQCPTTCRKDVHIRISVIQPDGNELCSTNFQVVSCATPLRDFKRFCQRQQSASLDQSSDCNLFVGPVEQTESDCKSDAKWKAKRSTVDCELDISPVSSGFASLSSPMGLSGALSEEDSNGQTCTRVIPKVSYAEHFKHCFSASPEDNSGAHSSLVLYEPASNGMDEYSRLSTVVAKRKRPNTESEETNVDRLVKEGQFTICEWDEPKKHLNQKNSDLSKTNTEEEYTIRTRNKHVYRILRILEQELTLLYGETSISTRDRTDPE
ncbi:hypothetical protein EG68_06770 [Paragonimus skrjabini miyazakii]|uniref:Uncharacterized protein n=1 Tax=Paragonimus skrjabini miyazakii TaxID=59628 RepID=A0A8S9YTP0_9TREM|nr:hypothetical protein EG68_06770 [Paragonimus skrjabini miyazakii]